RWSDVTESTLNVRRSIDSAWTKTPAGRRTLPLPLDAGQGLERHAHGLRLARLHGGLVFPTASGQPVTPHHANGMLRPWSIKAGVPRRTPHELRHTYASMMIATGVDPAELARLLGHTSPSFTLKRYVHFFEQSRPRRAPTLRELLDPQGG